METKLYVLGFAMDEKANHIVLVHKDRPEWQKGLINAVGGKIEDFDKNYPEAMAREFFEETGLPTFADDWQEFAILHFGEDKLGGEAMVFCFRLFSDAIFGVRTQETEKIEIFDIGYNFKGYRTLARQLTVGHLPVMVSMAKDKNFKFADIKMQ